MGRTRAEIMDALPEERRQKIDNRTAELLTELEGLGELRKLVGKTQKSLASKLGVKQPAVHQMEQQADMYISTLARYIEAAGGTLEFRVNLPATGPVVLSGFGDLRPARKAAVRPARQAAVVAHSG